MSYSLYSCEFHHWTMNSLCLLQMVYSPGDVWNDDHNDYCLCWTKCCEGVLNCISAWNRIPCRLAHGNKSAEVPQSVNASGIKHQPWAVLGYLVPRQIISSSPQSTCHKQLCQTSWKQRYVFKVRLYKNSVFHSPWKRNSALMNKLHHLEVNFPVFSISKER